MFKLYEYEELNQSKLMSYCGLNNVKHKGIIDDVTRYMNYIIKKRLGGQYLLLSIFLFLFHPWGHSKLP
jgi:hypothetical protein